MKPISKLLLLFCCCAALPGYGQDINTTNAQTGQQLGSADSKSCTNAGCDCSQRQTPLGVMTDHIHNKGEWMVSYTYTDMMMQGNQSGTAKASDNDVYKRYMMSPQTMSMQMHMAMVHYGITDKLTLMAMGGYAVSNMTMNMSDAVMGMPAMAGMNMGNMTMQSASGGFTDTKVTALYNLSDEPRQRLIGSMGINLPTGTIRATGTTAFGDNQRLPYDMQPGTGSFGIAPGLTYIRKIGLYSVGADAGADIKLNRNQLGYKDGNVYHATAWGSYRFLSFVSGSLRAEAVQTGKITGNDGPVFAAIDPTTMAANYGGTVVSAFAGLNFHVMKPGLNKVSLLVEYGIPVFQNLNGTQMALHGSLLAGVQYSL